jgi:glycosyltransferase 2 family protein
VEPPRLKRFAITLLKFSISLGILAVLFLLPSNQDAFQKIWAREKDWGLFALALSAMVLATVITFYRWQRLVLALGIAFPFREAVRLGFLGVLCNYISLGSVGGDLFKAVFIARQNPGRRPDVVGTVFFDRLVGLLVLLLTVTLVTLVAGLYRSDVLRVRMLCYASWGMSAAAIFGMGLLLRPGEAEGPIFRFLSARKKLGGPTLARLLVGLRTYREHLPLVGKCMALSFVAQVIAISATVLVAWGLQLDHTQVLPQFAAVPLSMLAASVPLPGGGLGTYEGTMEFMYLTLPNDPPFSPGEGTAVAVGSRVLMILVALVGVVYWLLDRREFQQVWQEAKEEEAKKEAAAKEESPSAEEKPAMR